MAAQELSERNQAVVVSPRRLIKVYYGRQPISDRERDAYLLNCASYLHLAVGALSAIFEFMLVRPAYALMILSSMYSQQSVHLFTSVLEEPVVDPIIFP